MAECDDRSGEGKPREGRYANYFQVGYNANEFVLDFGQDHGEGEQVLHSRIIMHPGYVPALIKLLSESVETWRREYAKG
jgi:hypothetical protein